jgi:hypothetical protein
MAIRNWWATIRCDGREHPHAFGPRAKEGGFSIELKQRDQGGIANALSIRGFVTQKGELKLSVDDGSGNNLYEYVTYR